MRQVLFVVLPEVVLLDVAGAADAFRTANLLMPGSYELSFIGPQPQITTGVGLEVCSLQSLPTTLADGSMIVIPGLVGSRVDLTAPSVRKVVRWLRDALANPSVTLICVCAGSVIGAAAGALSGRECTTHHEHIAELAQVDPSAIVHEDRIFVEDGRILTSAGVTAGIDLALHVIGQQLGHHVAAGVARSLVVYMRRAGNDPQLSPWLMHRNHMHAAVHRVQDAVTRNPTADWSASRLAAIGCTSERNLSRLFAEHAGCSPLDYVQRIRVALARELLTHSRLNIERVAQKAGFSSAHHLRRVWRRWESRAPSAQRHAE